MSIYRHRNKWYCRGRINGKRYNVACKNVTTKAEAKAFELQVRQNLLLEKEEKQLEQTFIFSFLMNRYVDVCRANNRTFKKSEGQCKFLCWFFGENTNIKNIKPSDIERLKAHLLSSGRTKATVNRYLAALKRAYNILIADELIDYNPVKKVKFFKEDNYRNRYLTLEEWNRLKKVLPEHTLNIISVALLTGLRRSNVLNLKWEQIDFNRRIITTFSEDTKGKKTLITPVCDSLYQLLLSLNPKPCGYVFVNPKTGKPYKTIRKSLDTAMKKTDIKNFRFHDIRRTVGTWLLENGVDIRTIQSLLGHSNIRVTERYLALTPSQNAKAMKYLDLFIN